MKAVVFHGIGDIRLDKVHDPKIQDPTDAIVRLTASAICGTDLHMIRGTFPGMEPGTILGHEGVGVVEEVGKDVRNFDRRRSRRHPLDHRLRLLLVLPGRLLLAMRQGEPQRQAGRDGLLRRSEADRPLPGPPGRAGPRPLRPRRDGQAAPAGDRRPGDLDLRHLPDRLLRRRTRRDQARRHRRGLRLRPGRAIRHRQRHAPGRRAHLRRRHRRLTPGDGQGAGGRGHRLQRGRPRRGTPAPDGRHRRRSGDRRGGSRRGRHPSTAPPRGSPSWRPSSTPRRSRRSPPRPTPTARTGYPATPPRRSSPGPFRAWPRPGRCRSSASIR